MRFLLEIDFRYELLSIVTTAILFKKPIIHISGGEKTEGAIDEQIRHMITKSAHIHFVSCNEYKMNIKKLGEPDWRIFNTGDIAVDNMANIKRLSKKKLFNNLKLKDKKTVLCTYHPVTLEFKLSPIKQIENLITALKHTDIQIVFTAPNMDADREKLLDYLLTAIKKEENFHYIESLGVLNYHSLITLCEFVIGNSSSGIVEVSFFKIPTVNVGDRQKGRVRHKSVIDVDYSVEEISKGIEKAMSKEFKAELIDMEYKFGDGKAAEKMVEIIKNIKIDEKLMRKNLC